MQIRHQADVLLVVLLAGDCAAYDAKIGDFGLHATVEQTDRSDSVRQL